MKVVSKFLLLTICALSMAACDNNKTVAKSDSKFSLISDKCQLIGAIDINEIAKMESVQKMTQEENKAIPYYKEIKAAGLGIENLNRLYFGAEIPTDANQANLQAQGVFLLVSKSKINLPEFIALAEKNNDNAKFKTSTVGSKQAYIISDDSNTTLATYIIQLSDTLIAVGTESEIASTVSLFEKGGKSVLNNAQLMKVANNAQGKDMVWFAASVPPEVNKSNDPNTPDINDLFIGANYVNDTLLINGEAACATEQDAQKIMLPAQILTSMAVMSSNNTIKPEDLILKTDKNNFSVNLKLSKAALTYMMEKRAEPAQPAMTEETIVSEEAIVPAVTAPTPAVTTPVAAPVTTTTITTITTTAPAATAPVPAATKDVSAPAPTPAVPVAPVQEKGN